jgi:hypothetical protein
MPSLKINEAQIAALSEACKQACISLGGVDAGLQAYHAILKIKDPTARWDLAAEVIRNAKDPTALETTLTASPAYRFTHTPVTPAEFLDDPNFLDASGTLYPEVRKCFFELNDPENGYQEAVMTGGIGSGKTTLALYSQAYQLYLLSLMANPQGTFGLDPSSEILIIFQSIKASLAKSVDFDRFRAMLENVPYFRKQFPFNPDLQSKLIFPNRIIVLPVAGTETAAIGQNVIGGILDEVNYMAVIENSKASIDGGTFDQAVALYNSISRRRESRFMQMGNLPGLLCLVSSKRYPGQFTDRKEEEAKSNPSIYVYDKRTWEVKPPGAYSGKTFNIFVGDQFRRPRIMTEEDKVAPDQRDLVMPVPVEHRADFERDMLSALREIAGVSTLAVHPFLHNTDAVGQCVRENMRNLSFEETVDFVNLKVKLRAKMMKESSAFDRWVHIDLGLTSDSAGIVMGHVSRFVRVKRGENTIELLPLINIDLVLEVRPPPSGEINFAKIRELIYLMSKEGVPIRWVTYDSFQSRDSLQLLRSQGYVTGLLSMDGSPVPYDVLKTAIYDTRVRMPKHDKLVWELTTLERDPKTGKVDHPANSSKDISDALAGVVYGLSTRLEVYAQHNVSVGSVPQWLLAQAGKARMTAGETPESADAVTSGN